MSCRNRSELLGRIPLLLEKQDLLMNTGNLINDGKGNLHKQKAAVYQMYSWLQECNLIHHRSCVRSMAIPCSTCCTYLSQSLLYCCNDVGVLTLEHLVFPTSTPTTGGVSWFRAELRGFILLRSSALKPSIGFIGWFLIGTFASPIHNQFLKRSYL